jgi:conjugative transfer signal peptidase TraF
MVAQQPPQLHFGVLTMQRTSSNGALIIMSVAFLFATLFAALTAFRPLPIVIWNASDSVPIGVYFVSKRQPKVGEIAVIALPEWFQRYASSRGYLPANVWLLKPVFAAAGSIVCRIGRYVFVDGNLVARAKIHDRRNRLLPSWKGCQTLKLDEVFVLAKPPYSFDGRYFGPIERSQIIGTAIALDFP